MLSYPRRLPSGHFTCYLNRTYHVLTTLLRQFLERFHALGYACGAVEEERGQSCPTVLLGGNDVSIENAEWSYYLGCVSAAVAIVYRAFWFGALGACLFGAPRVVPHNFLELSILLFVVAIAGNAHVMVHREEGR
jgi:hypothetical protein